MNALGDAVLTQIARVQQPGIDRRGLRLLTLLWAATNVVEFVVWATMSVVTLDVDQPWWLWSLVLPGLALAAAWRLTGPRGGASGTR